MKTARYKIPGRMIVCDTPLSWLKEMLWVYVVMKIFKSDIDAITEKPENLKYFGISEPKG